MAKQLNNCLYNKIKLLHELSSIAWFIEKHAQGDAKSEQEQHCHQFLEALAQDLDRHIAQLKEMVCKD